MIPKELEQEIKDAVKIEDIIKGYNISLTRAGVNLKGKCPFHNEETASFTVSPVKGIYKCFGCGAFGDAFKFVMEKDVISYPEALKRVGKIYNITVPDKELTQEQVIAYKKREEELNELARQNRLFKSGLEKNSKAMEWLCGEREIDGETIKKWGLGYAESGFFFGRITYPFHNFSGEIAGFTGRRLNKELEPKFKNSADSNLFKKAELLYGLHHARLKIHAKNKCYLVEGQHDVLMMHQAGFENTVAPSGTALTVKQIRLIKPWTKNIVMLLDGDTAGLKAVMRLIADLLSEQINLRIIQLPEGHDPDTFLRKDIRAKGKEFIENNEIDFIEFKTNILKEQLDNDPSLTAELISEITADIGLINDKNERMLHSRKCAEIFGIKNNELNKDIARLREKLKGKAEDGKWFAFDFEETKKAIEEAEEVNILSNFEDVVDYHLNNQQNYIGMNCFPILKSEILKLKKLTKKVIYNELIKEFYDSRTNEESATVLNLKRVLSYGIDVRIREERVTRRKVKSDNPDEDQYDEFLEVYYLNMTDWYIQKVTGLLNFADDLYTGWAIENIAELISYLPESSRMVKLNNVQAEFKAAKVKLIVGDFKKILEKYLKKNAKSFEPNIAEIDLSDNPMNLTTAQLTDLNRYQHYFDKNSIWHVAKTGHIGRISNFTITPIIHSNTSTGHFKLFEMTNEYGLKVNISLDTKDLNDLKRFKCSIEEKGNFIFKGDQFQLDNIKERLYSNTTYSDEIEQLGWQSEGFWAWGDGVTTVGGEFCKTDENGLITVADKNYLIKPFSNLYAKDKTAYINEKKFVHLTSKATFEDWNFRYIDVFGNNAMICTCALLTGLFSDAIFKLVHGELPLLNFFGPKGTGKTQQADSILAFFGEKQPVNNLSKVTIYGLSQTLKSFHNAFVLIDEYKNSLDMKFIEMLKSIFNRQGKIQGNFASAGTKTEHIPINQMVLLCGQDLPTLDVALLERCICLTAYKNEYTDVQKNRYNELKDMEEKGFAHLTDDFIKYRDLVIEKFGESNMVIQKVISEKCTDVSVRLQKNLSTVLTTFYILKDKFKFAFTYDQVLEFGMQTIRDQQKFIESSDDLKNFWTIFLTLIEQDKLKEGRNYMLHQVNNIRYVGQEEAVIYGKGLNCLFLRWEGLYPLYAEYSRRSNMVALGEKTIQFYLEKTKYYQGKIKAKRFKDKFTQQQWISQAYCFDYDRMDINLIESQVNEYDNPDLKITLNYPVAEATDQSLPF